MISASRGNGSAPSSTGNSLKRGGRPGELWGAYHWREYRIESLLPPAESARRVLLLGCGDASERPYLDDLGFECVGLDVRRSSGVQVLGDAHELPFADGSFDIVLSMQVLEHLHSPWKAVVEFGRILRPGGWFIGSVAFLKPYHGSYFHMTHLGVQQLLKGAGLVPERFHGAQSPTYSLIGTMLPIGTRGVRRALLSAVDRMIALVRVRLWSWTRHGDPDRPSGNYDPELRFSFRQFDRLRFAAAVVFRAQKPSGGRE